MGLFNRKPTVEQKNFETETKRIDRELDLYYRTQKIEVDKRLLNAEHAMKKKILDLKIEGTEQLGEYEHEYHQTMQDKGIAIALLEAKHTALELAVKAREEVIKADQHTIDTLKEHIKTLTSLNEKLIAKIEPSKVHIIKD